MAKIVFLACTGRRRRGQNWSYIVKRSYERCWRGSENQYFNTRTVGASMDGAAAIHHLDGRSQGLQDEY